MNIGTTESSWQRIPPLQIQRNLNNYERVINYIEFAHDLDQPPPSSVQKCQRNEIKWSHLKMEKKTHLKPTMCLLVWMNAWMHEWLHDGVIHDTLCMASSCFDSLQNIDRPTDRPSYGDARTHLKMPEHFSRNILTSVYVGLSLGRSVGRIYHDFMKFS